MRTRRRPAARRTAGLLALVLLAGPLAAAAPASAADVPGGGSGDVDGVVRLDPARLDGSAVATDRLAQEVRRLLSGEGRYLLRRWVREQDYELGTGPGGDALLRLPEERRNSEVLVRGGALVALTHAVGVEADGYDPALVDVAAARAQALQLVDAVVDAHRTTRMTYGWGRSWQSALWASQLGLAAWLLWDDLSPSLRAGVLGVVADEADGVVSRATRVYRSPDGEVQWQGDSASEELSWDARLLSLAVAMSPDDPRASGWRYAQVQRQLLAFARPQDALSQEVVHGAPLCAWLPGSSVDADGTIVNHRRIHPSYMRWPNAAADVLHGQLTGRHVSRSAVHGLAPVYEALVDQVFDAPPYDSPGGTIYQPDGDVYYPQGNDWGTAQPVQFLLQDLQASALDLDGSATTRARVWAQRHLSEVTDQAARSAEGNLYASPEEYLTVLREPDAGDKLASAWLTMVLARTSPPRYVDEPLAVPQETRAACYDAPLPSFDDTAGEVAASASWLASRGVVKGVGDGAYAPNTPLTRGQMVVVLHREVGRPDAAPSPFADAQDGEVAAAVGWAVEEGLAQGRTPTAFAPLDTVRRDQLVRLLWRQAGRPAPSSDQPHPFADVPAEGELAEALAWAVEAGLVQGRTPDTFAPADPVTRGQAALVLHRRAGSPVPVPEPPVEPEPEPSLSEAPGVPGEDGPEEELAKAAPGAGSLPPLLEPATTEAVRRAVEEARAAGGAP